MQFFFELVTVQNHELNIDAKVSTLKSDNREFKVMMMSSN